MHIPEASILPTPPRSWVQAPPQSAPTIDAEAIPSVTKVMGSVAAMAAVACAAALGAADVGTMARAIPALVAPALGAAVLTAPALLAVHQFLGLDAPPERLVAAIARALVQGGRVALGLVPIALLFAVTSGLWPLVLALAVLVPGITMTAVALVGLRAAESDARVMSPRFALLLIGWSTLWIAIALRIAISMAQLVIAGGAL
jgi:hypothetical protein